MRRIAHVISTPSGIGGAERMLGSLIAAGHERGYEQIVLNPFAGPAATLSDIVTGAPVIPIPCRSIVSVPALRRRVRQELRRFEPHVVHAHLFHAQVTVATLGLRTPTIATHHHGELYDVTGNRGRLLLDRLAMRKFDSVVAVSDSVSRYLVENYNLIEDKVVTIRNGWEGVPLPRSYQQGLIVSVANFRTEKDHETLLEAFAKLRANNGNARLRLIGSGPLEQSLKDLAGRLNISEFIDFRGSVDDVWAELSAAHVFALCSIVEPLGMAALEAMAACVPVVATNVGGLPEIIDHGRSGYLVSPGDADGFANALEKVMMDSARAEEMGSYGAQRAKDFAMSVTTDRYFELYERLAG